MHYAIIVMLETERTPGNIIHEIVATLEFDVATKTTVNSVVVLIDDGVEVAVYDRDRKSD